MPPLFFFCEVIMEPKAPFYLYRVTHIQSGFFFYAVTISEQLAGKKLRDTLQPRATPKAKPERQAFYNKMVEANAINPKARMKVRITDWSISIIHGPSTFQTCHSIRKEILHAAKQPGYLIHPEKH